MKEVVNLERGRLPGNSQNAYADVLHACVHLCIHACGSSLPHDWFCLLTLICSVFCIK